jgi:hypothetical protein
VSNKKLDAPDALAQFARIFWEEAIRQVEAEIEAEEKAAGIERAKPDGNSLPTTPR